MGALILVAVVIVALYLFFKALSKRGLARLCQILAEQNRLHGTAFPTSAHELGTYALMGIGLLMAFDTKNKKICLVRGGKDARILDYSHIRGWKLHWVETSKDGRLSYRDVHFQFNTNDITQPTLRVPIMSKRVGEDWDNRLRIIFG